MNSYPLKWISILYYKLALRVVILLFQKKGEVEIWPRHSYYEGGVVYFLSDIDLTFYLLNNQNLQIEKMFKILKLLFPILVEYRTVRKNELMDIVTKMNVFELKRDPKLFEKIKDLAVISNNLEVERIVFLLRCLVSDWENLIKRPQMRVMKWRSHFLRCNLIPLDQTIFSDSNNIRYNITRVISSDIESKTGLNLPPSHVMKIVKTCRYHHLDQVGVLESRFCFVCLPQFWINVALHTDQLGIYEKKFDLTEFEMKIIKRQLDWELAGILTNPESKKNQQLHLNHIQMFKKSYLRMS